MSDTSRLEGRKFERGRGKIGERACAIKERSDGFKLGWERADRELAEKGDMKGVKRIRRQGESEK